MRILMCRVLWVHVLKGLSQHLNWNCTRPVEGLPRQVCSRARTLFLVVFWSGCVLQTGESNCPRTAVVRMSPRVNLIQEATGHGVAAAETKITALSPEQKALIV